MRHIPYTATQEYGIIILKILWALFMLAAVIIPGSLNFYQPPGMYL